MTYGVPISVLSGDIDYFVVSTWFYFQSLKSLQILAQMFLRMLNCGSWHSFDKLQNKACFINEVIF